MQNPPNKPIHDENPESTPIENKQGRKIEDITFTPREWDILACMSSGATVSKEIAQSLGISFKTVETHIAHILIKIQSHSRHHIASFIKEAGCQKELSDFYHDRLSSLSHHKPKWSVLTKEFWMMNKVRFAVVLLTLCCGACFIFFHGGVRVSAKYMTLKTTPSYLLPRIDLMDCLEKSLSQHNHSVVAILGAGGVGKTTLARLYGQKSQAHVVLEVNAEHAASLLSSFMNIADQLIQTLEQRTTFQKIQSFQDATERTRQLVSFVYRLLAEQPSWLLILDNVSDLAAVRSFLPPQPLQEQSSGHVIITTRDQNIQHSPLVSAVINVDELSPDESFTLFTQLLKNHRPSDHEKKAIEAFLSKIPPFPLDISLAAHYIRDAHLSFNQYLERLNRHQPTFHQHEEKLWQDVSDYPQTRYAIVTLSATRLLEQNPKYLDRLWMMTLIDSQNIPVDLLRYHQDPSLVDPFVHALRTMSFMIGESDNHAHHVFSIHRSTQAILKHYLKITYGEPSVDTTASALIQCARHAMEEGDVQTMSQLIPHFEALPVPKHLPFYITLGMLYYHTAQYAKAKRLLEDEWQFEQRNRDISRRDLFHGDVSQGDLSRRDSSQDETRLKILIYLGHTYKELMESEKAAQTLQQALALCQQHFLHHPSEHIKLLVGLANVYRRLGNFAKAEELCSQCLSLCEKNNFTDYTDLAAIHMALCVAHREQGHYKKAEENIHKSLDIFEHHLSHQYLDHAHAIRLLGHVCSDQGLYLQARDLYQKSLDIFVQHQQENHPKALWLYVKLGTLCRRLGEIEQAHIYLDKAEHSEAFATSYVVQGLTYHERAHLSIQQGDYDKALALARQSHGVYTQLFGANHVKVRRALNLVGYAAMFKGDFDEAEQCMKMALQTFTQYQLPLRCQALDYLSELYRRRLSQAKPEQEDALRQQALSYADQALSVAEEYFPPDSKHVTHLKKQRDLIVATHTGDDQKNKDMTKRCQ